MTSRLPSRCSWLQSDAGFVFLGLLVCTVSVALVYHQVLHHQFLDWDDNVAYVNNEYLHTFSRENIWWLLTTSGDGIWKPLTYFSFMVEFQWLPLDKPGLHLLINPLIHSVNAVLVGLLVFKILSLPGILPASRELFPYQRMLAGLLSAFWFALHPLNVEAAVWLSGRKELLCALFYLLSVYCWIRYLDVLSVSGSKPSRYWFALAWICQLLAFLCKSMAVSLPFVFLLLDHLFRRPHPWSTRLLEKWPFWLLSALIVPVAIWGQRAVGALGGGHDIPLLIRIAQAVDSYSFYLFKLVWPAELLPHYPAWTAVPPVRFVVDLLGLMLLLVLGVVFRYERRVILLIIGWYLVVLMPVSGILQIGDHRAADRYAYLPTIPWYGLAATSLVILTREQWHRLLLAVLLSGLVIGILSDRQVRIWRDGQTLWEYTLRREPDMPMPLMNLGVYFLQQKDTGKALYFLKRASDEAPKDIYFLETWMMACAELKMWDCALEASHRGMTLFPDDYHFKSQTGFFLAFRGDTEQALAYFEQANSLHPGDPAVLWGQANMLAGLHRQQEALVVLEHLLAVKPDHAKARMMRDELLTHTTSVPRQR